MKWSMEHSNGSKYLPLTTAAVVTVVFLLAGFAHAFLLYHQHGVGQTTQTENFVGTTQTHKVGIKAPTIGGMFAAIRLDGNNVASCSISAGGTCCDTEPLTVDTYEFISFADVTSGVAKAWVWGQDAQSPPIQLCSGGGGN